MATGTTGTTGTRAGQDCPGLAGMDGALLVTGP
jgi:hypothetical protein